MIRRDILSRQLMLKLLDDTRTPSGRSRFLRFITLDITIKVLQDLKSQGKINF